MSRPVRIGIQLWPGGAPDDRSWREAVLRAEDLGADILFGYDHFHAPAFEPFVGKGRCWRKSSPTSSTSKLDRTCLMR
jgi:alkanesulfonate monooxygenase SsuD/methylene tetrahydromethanopterin reductase-like flavin-dependent oxidoreductase (luciferase family)